jgi:ABC-type antimicrobial peptide transport system permease subunit
MSSALALTLVQGTWPSGSRQILVGDDLARITMWRIGSTVNIYGVDFQVTGLVRAAENNVGAIWMTYPEGQNLFGMEHGFQVGYLSLVPSADPESVRNRIQADPRIAAQYTVYLENAVSDGYNQVNHNLVTLSSIMSIISLLAITFGIYTSTSLSLAERGREIVLLNVVGVTPGKLRTFLFTRALIITLVAYGLGWVLLDTYIHYLNSQKVLGFSEAPMSLNLTASASLLGLGLASAFAFMGVWWTSRRFTALRSKAGGD